MSTAKNHRRMAEIASSHGVLLSVLVLCATAVMTLSAQTFTTLFSFNGTDGSGGASPLVEGLNGNFYGTTTVGGANCAPDAPLGCGTVFKITPSGNLTTLHKFCAQSGCPDGEEPAGLVQGSRPAPTGH